MAAETLGTGNAVFDALLTLSAPQARNAFDQVSGEVHASARGVILEDSHFPARRLAGAPARHGQRARGQRRRRRCRGRQAGPPAALLRELAHWGRAMGSWGHVNGDGNAATVKRDTSGFLMGADTRFGEEGRFGVMGGYSRSAFDVATATPRAPARTITSVRMPATVGAISALRTGVSYSWHDVSTSRSVAFPGFTDSLKADYKAGTTQAFAELGYRIKTERAELEPFASLAHVNVASDGFTERGGAAALASSGNSTGVTFSTLGLRASTNLAMEQRCQT